jgi:hypothetical protein
VADPVQPPACEGHVVRPAVTRAVDRAQSLVDRASEASSSRQAKLRLQKAVHQLSKARRVVRRKSGLPAACIVAVRTNLEALRLQAEMLARTL